MKTSKKIESIGKPKETRVYISGPMTGYPDCNWPAFERAEKILSDLGYSVFSPRVDDFVHKLTPKLLLRPGFLTKERLKKILRRDLFELFICDAVCTLKGWESSLGAQAEVSVARFLQLPIIPLEP